MSKVDIMDGMKPYYQKIKDWFLSENSALSLLLLSFFLLIGILFCQFLNGNYEEKIGSLISGIVVCFISIANAILLYRTLKVQVNGNKTRDDVAKQERFETTLFNLLDKYFEQIYRIKFEAIILQNPPIEVNITINGSSFIAFAFEQLSYLKVYFAKDYYLGYYDSSSDSKGYDYKPNSKEEAEYDEYLHTKYMANIYGISKEKFDLYKEQIKKKQKTSLQICYYLFYCRWGRCYDHYLRMVKTIVEYIKSKGDDVSDINYLEIFKGYISSKEQRFLYYHASIDNEFAEALNGTVILDSHFE